MPDKKPDTAKLEKIDEIEDQLEQIFEGEEKLCSELRRLLRHGRIRYEFSMLKDERYGEADEIRRELAEKYYNNPDRTSKIWTILYRKY